jgi:hypothetical protein
VAIQRCGIEQPDAAGKGAAHGIDSRTFFDRMIHIAKGGTAKTQPGHAQTGGTERAAIGYIHRYLILEVIGCAGILAGFMAKR